MAEIAIQTAVDRRKYWIYEPEYSKKDEILSTYKDDSDSDSRVCPESES
jgi:hypothetical protein